MNFAYVHGIFIPVKCEKRLIWKIPSFVKILSFVTMVVLADMK